MGCFAYEFARWGRAAAVLGCALAILACGSSSTRPTDSPDVEGSAESGASPESDGADGGALAADAARETTTEAVVTEVRITGQRERYTFGVTIASPDTGCDQYADWWEVLRADGTLLYRRILAHSHVDEQPFTRTGGPVAIEPTDTVTVRAHMHPGGYGTQAIRGSVDGEFASIRVDADFAAAAEREPPQPSGCAF